MLIVEMKGRKPRVASFSNKTYRVAFWRNVRETISRIIVVVVLSFGAGFPLGGCVAFDAFGSTVGLGSFIPSVDGVRRVDRTTRVGGATIIIVVKIGKGLFHHSLGKSFAPTLQEFGSRRGHSPDSIKGRIRSDIVFLTHVVVGSTRHSIKGNGRKFRRQFDVFWFEMLAVTLHELCVCARRASKSKAKSKSNQLKV